MKKIFSFKTYLLFLLLYCLVIPTSYAEQKSIESLPVSLELESEVVFSDESFTVTAKIPKKLELYSDTWSRGAEDITTFEDGDYYFSKATYTPSGIGFQPVVYKMEQKLEDGTIKYIGEANLTVLVVEPTMDNGGVQILPLESSVSLDKGGQAVLIARIPLKYADKGYSGGWDSTVNSLGGPVISDGVYSYSVAIFKPKETGTYQVRFIALSHGGKWYAADSITIEVVE
ncbi:hypothetical protein ACFLFF_30470 [Brevibacillus reuszeri]|uniref:hypothetical protein n=1 Tax=Brevibacillus reuszeri TaxID=54915 RepID=UPI00366EC5B0